ncbi:heparanase [Galleria mellonella]|uniref:Heparanase n=1 Tax=Galleria mellonella TaxID=7137 RepID=A0A6J3BVQ6_GALME|nr:heparanase [Galleria mellonella]
MNHIISYFVLYSTLSILNLVSADTFSVKIGTDQHVNVVDRRFLSFTVDPKFLFSSADKYNSKEYLCMATSLTPAYLRIAGPSTAHMSFRNSSISIDDLNPDDLDMDRDLEHHKDVLDKLLRRRNATLKRQVQEKLTVSSNQWEQFAKWAKTTGFELVFALNNNVKTRMGMWDPNTALDILTIAEKTNIGKMYWQLGYECNNQSIEEYLNDLETLRLIVETFIPGSENKWKVVGGDVTNCLQAESKSDFKDFVTLSVEMLDAVLLNGNSSSRELERMSDYDRLKLLKLLSESDTPLWLTETTRKQYNELERAANWMASLGYSARNGFSVHYRELLKEELFEPTLSFYMALLFKNLVGERVLDVESSQAVIFAHCTSLRHKQVPGAVTLFAANMEDESARFSVKLSKREEGGDIMQFILGHDNSGNIVVNGRAMFYEGDIKPIIKRVRPYKTLLINLPSKSFGFWVLANTKVDACYDVVKNSNQTQLVEALDVSDVNKNTHKVKKRSIDIDDFDYLNIAEMSEDFADNDEIENLLNIENEDIKNRIEDLNMELKKVHKLFENNEKNGINKNLRKKRQTDLEENEGKYRKIKKHIMKPKHHIKKMLDDFKNKGFIGNILPLNGKRHFKNNRFEKQRRKEGTGKIVKNKEINENSQNVGYETVSTIGQVENNKEILSRYRRNAVFEEKSKFKLKDGEKENVNEIETDADNTKLWKVLHKMQKQLSELQSQNENQHHAEYEDDKSKENGQILVKTKVFDDGATINLSEHPNHGLIKSTVENMFSVLGELNTNLNRFWSALTLLE